MTNTPSSPAKRTSGRAAKPRAKARRKETAKKAVEPSAVAVEALAPQLFEIESSQAATNESALVARTPLAEPKAAALAVSTIDSGLFVVRRGGPQRFRKVLITGYGRSGTSAVAAVFREFGFHLGNSPLELVGEDAIFRGMLQSGAPADLARELEKWSGEHPGVAWKDPKIYGTSTNAFVKLLPDDWLVIGVFRDPVAVALRRGKSEGDDLSNGVADAIKFQAKLNVFLQATTKTVAFLSYEKLLFNPIATLESLLNFIEPPKLKHDLADLWASAFGRRAEYRAFVSNSDQQGDAA